MDYEYEVKLGIFEGPLDLLLHLIYKNEVDIFDIPIASITDQYLEYLDLMKALNINVAGDFLLMAATLVHIKSRMLLPGAEGGEEEDDPRLEITRPLLEYMRIKEAAQALDEREILERDVFGRRPSSCPGRKPEGRRTSAGDLPVSAHRRFQAGAGAQHTRYRASGAVRKVVGQGQDGRDPGAPQGSGHALFQ